MHNPLVLLFKEALDELIAQGHYYYIRQSYPRGKTAGVREAFLVTPYTTYEQANKHYEAIKSDRRRYLYLVDDGKYDKWSVEMERKKLYVAATQPEGYRVYLNRLKDRSWKCPAELGAKIKGYIKRNTHWKPRGADIEVGLSLQFGELVVNLEYQGDKVKVRLDEIEEY
ncbi:hypothetical protein [uncultured Chitinophaga sp.]|jgi:hypothetical protein|uniref:hypothetical protein n=1 Tax=uncultured Chitinophaga sp. TaxID=339340 RepID=UPI00260BF797|nr:hypothetical protein [uncultured Chitinophaga sp.]